MLLDGLYKFVDVCQAIFTRNENLYALLSNEQHNLEFLFVAIIFASLSEFIGQYYLFVLNSVKRLRLLAVLISLILINIITTLIYGLFVHVLLLFFGLDINYVNLSSVIAFSLVPRLFAFLTIIPIIGESISKLIQTISLFLLVFAVNSIWEVPLRETLIILGVGFAIIYVFRQTTGKYLTKLESKILQLVSGQPFEKYDLKSLLNKLQFKNDNP